MLQSPKERAEDRAERIEMREKIEAMEREKEEGRREGDVGENSGDAEGERCGEEGDVGRDGVDGWFEERQSRRFLFSPKVEWDWQRRRIWKDWQCSWTGVL
jgi:hypothetical protein